MKKSLIAAVLFSLLITAAPAFAQSSGKGEGEVRRIDKEAGKVTIKHGPIEGMDMPGMTMVFQVRDATLFDKLAAGETISFTVARENGAMVLTSATPKR